ncbi:MAG TPA: HTTM domain-containing protein [Blastocatellia bacterium]|jgi:hypothetical protein
MKHATLSSFKKRIISFLEDPYSPAPLGFFRLTIAGFLLLQAAMWYPDWPAFMRPDGWLQWEISHAITEEWAPHIEQLYRLFGPLGLSAEKFVTLFFWCYVIAGVGLLLGWRTRVWAVIVWLCHYVIMGTLRTFTYGVDIFLQIALFYMMFMPVAKAYSLDVWQKRVSPRPTWGVTLSLRTLQIHMCLVYLSAGFEKAMSPDWWGGNVIWRSLVQPDFRQFDLTWLAHYPWIAVALGWFTIILETGYCLAMWIPRVRVFWLAGVISLHLGIGLFLGLRFFGLIMILLSVSAFGYGAWQDARDRLRRTPRRRLQEEAAVPVSTFG